MIKTAIFDIDDTLISSSEYTSNSGLSINMDIQNRKVIDLLQQLKDRNFYILIMTNRNENTFRATKKELRDIPYDRLIMRYPEMFTVTESAGFKRFQIKKLREHNKHYIEYFIDDQTNNCHMAIRNHIPNVGQVNSLGEIKFL